MKQRPLRPLVPILAVVAAAAGPLLAQTAIEAPVLRVQGSAEIRVVPDLAVVRLGVANEAQTAQEAQQAVNSASAVVLDAMRRVGGEFLIRPAPRRDMTFLPDDFCREIRPIVGQGIR